MLLAVGVGTSLSLLGDTALYTVLPTHTDAAGVTVLSVGILLSANRWIRLVLNGPAGFLYERWPRRRLFLPALFVGALSTGIYAFTTGFWPLLAGRLLWGLAWAGIWVGGNTIIIDMTHAGNRGRWVGAFQVSFFLGVTGGSLLGGILTDILGYHGAMAVNFGLTALGALLALALLPETRGANRAFVDAREPADETEARLRAVHPVLPRGSFAAAMALMAANRFVVPGILISTLGLYIARSLGDPVHLFGRTPGVATVTGLALSANALTAMAASPLTGRLSDWLRNRWAVAAGGLVLGLGGFLLFVGAPPHLALLGIPLVAMASASSQAMSTALAGDIAHAGRHGRRLGVLFTVGDLASAIGPPLAFGLIPFVEIRGVYVICAGIFGVMLLASLHQFVRARRPATALMYTP